MKFLTEVRLRVKELGKNILAIAIFVVIVLFVANFISKFFKTDYKPKKRIIHKNEKKSVLNEGKSPSTKAYNKTTKIIYDFVASCNEFKFDKAYIYLSKGSKQYFGSYDNFENYIKRIFNEQKRYNLQAYSKVDDIDVYQLKLFSDFLATGLTKQEYNYLDLKLAVKLDKNEPNGVMLNINGYIKTDKLKDVMENDDLRIDYLKSTVLYKSEIIEAEIHNKTPYYLVVKDFDSAVPEVAIDLDREDRPDIIKSKIVLRPYEKGKFLMQFSKFADDGKTIKNIKLNDIRFKKEYNKNLVQIDDKTKFEEDNENIVKKYRLETPIRSK